MWAAECGSLRWCGMLPSVVGASKWPLGLRQCLALLRFVFLQFLPSIAAPLTGSH